MLITALSVIFYLSIFRYSAIDYNPSLTNHFEIIPCKVVHSLSQVNDSFTPLTFRIKSCERGLLFITFFADFLSRFDGFFPYNISHLFRI